MRILGIDIGGTRLKAGLVDDAGQISCITSTRTPATLAEFREEMKRIAVRREIPSLT